MAVLLLVLVLVGLSSCAAEDDKILISFSSSSVTIEDGSSRSIYMTVIKGNGLHLNLTLESPLLHINCTLFASSCSDVLVQSPDPTTIEVVVMVDPIEEGSPIQIYPPHSFEVEIYSGGKALDEKKYSFPNVTIMDHRCK